MEPSNTSVMTPDKIGLNTGNSNAISKPDTNTSKNSAPRVYAGFSLIVPSRMPVIMFAWTSTPG